MNATAGHMSYVQTRHFGAILALMLTFAVAGCSERGKDVPIVPPPAEKPEPPTPDGPTQAELREARAQRNREANQTAANAGTDTVSQARRTHYSQVEHTLASGGRLRQDHQPADVSLDAETLARDFIQIALHDEYDSSGAQNPQGISAPLRKWTQPVTIRTAFGPSSDVATRRVIQGEIISYAGRLSGATGHPVTTTDGKGNFTVLVLSETERRDIGRYLKDLAPSIPANDVAKLTQLSPDIYCTVFAYSTGNSYDYAHAIALIRAELPPLMRLSCIHEELAQGMGLANDSQSVRPSIFNDDEEFALLTKHDELLLKILYDPRLRTGMMEEQAAPIVREIAGELLSN